jgi:hypothetical protein
MYKKIYPQLSEENQRQYNPLFCSYLTGLVEGDGTIIVPKVARNPAGKLNYPLGYTRGYLLKIFYGNVNKNIRHFSTTSSIIYKEQSVNINPWFITGFADGESSFSVGVTPKGWI